MKSTQETVLHLSSKERLDNLEATVKSLQTALQEIAEANQTLALQLASVTMNLNNSIKRNNVLRSELRAMIEIVSSGEKLDAKAISDKVIAANVEELKKRLETLKKNKLIEKAEDIQADGFVVAMQTDKDGNVVNARMQFLVSDMDDEIQSKILSKRAGETVIFGGEEPDLYIMEVYKTVNPENLENTEQSR
jgi:hypothetical protein